MNITAAEYQAYTKGISTGVKLNKIKTPRAKSQGEESLARQLSDAGIKYHREFRFDPERRWKFDFVLGAEYGCIAIECEGGIWQKSRHTSPKGYAADLEKYNRASTMGWKVLRFTTDMITNGTALTCIQRAIA